MSRFYFKDSPFYREVYDWYRVIYRYYLSLGLNRLEAKRNAYDSIELRFNIKYSWARKIISCESKSISSIGEREKGIILQNNKQLLDYINIVNGEYERHR